MKDTNTAITIMDQWMKDLFRQGIRDLSGPGDTMYDSEVRKNVDFGKLLHKEGLWSLYKYKYEYNAGLGQSLMYHLCRGYTGLHQVNSLVRPRTGDCTACGSKSPDEIRGIWTLHNFDWIQQNGGNTFYGDMGL